MNKKLKIKSLYRFSTPLLFVFLISCNSIKNNNANSIVDLTNRWEFTDLGNLSILNSVENIEDYGFYYPAELGELEELTIYNEDYNKGNLSFYRGSGYVGIWDNSNNNDSKLTFTVDMEIPGSYQLIFFTSSIYGEKYNNVVVNGRMFSNGIHTKSLEFEPSSLSVNLKKGINIIEVTESWGWFFMDGLLVRPDKGIDENVYNVEKELVNKKATKETKSLMSYLVDIYGKSTLSGLYQYDSGINSKEFKAIYNEIGKYPAIMGLDLIDYSPSRVMYGANSKSIEDAIQWHDMGGIVTFAWHWNAPKDLINSGKTPWWKGFYTEGTTFDFSKALSGEDKDGQTLLLENIDEIATQLKKLQNAKVPVLWRPLHEASGGWFWWGTKGPEKFKELWILMYDRLTNVHGLNNLIWVFNGQAGDWYPGDEFVDIISEDIYAPKKDYSSQKTKFKEALEYTSTNKIIALSENGVVPDPDEMFLDNVKWSFFATWNGEFIINPTSGKISSEYTDLEQLKKVYNHKNVITLDELPDLKNYPIK